MEILKELFLEYAGVFGFAGCAILLVCIFKDVILIFAKHSNKKPDNLGQILRQNILKTSLVGVSIAFGSLFIIHLAYGYNLAQLRQISSYGTTSTTSSPPIELVAYSNDNNITIHVITSTVKKPNIPSTPSSLQLFNLMNTARVAPFVYNLELENIAIARVKYLCSIDTFSHSGFKDFFGDSLFNYVGENLARNYANEQDVFNAFMKSPTHRANIQNTQYQYVGIAEDCGITVVSFGGYSN